MALSFISSQSRRRAQSSQKIVKEEVAILMVSGSYESIQEIAAIGKRLLGATAVYVKKPDGSTILL
jgi:hypothetical protein